MDTGEPNVNRKTDCSFAILQQCITISSAGVTKMCNLSPNVGSSITVGNLDKTYDSFY